MIKTCSKFNQKSKQEETRVAEEVEDEEHDDQLPVQTDDVQKVEPPVLTVEKKEVKAVPDNQGSTNPQRQGNPVTEEDDEDSEWDSEEVSLGTLALLGS